MRYTYKHTCTKQIHVCIHTYINTYFHTLMCLNIVSISIYLHEEDLSSASVKVACSWKTPKSLWECWGLYMDICACEQGEKQRRGSFVLNYRENSTPHNEFARLLCFSITLPLERPPATRPQLSQLHTKSFHRTFCNILPVVRRLHFTSGFHTTSLDLGNRP